MDSQVALLLQVITHSSILISEQKNERHVDTAAIQQRVNNDLCAVKKLEMSAA